MMSNDLEFNLRFSNLILDNDFFVVLQLDYISQSYENQK